MIEFEDDKLLDLLWTLSLLLYGDTDTAFDKVIHEDLLDWYRTFK